jgi:hypothetical protein|tara:strand:+ start:913 stop:1095 length:183 start_codon:yes stop_codon:yes gene_type:complete
MTNFNRTLNQKETYQLITLRDALAESAELNFKIGNVEIFEERMAEFNKLGETLYGRKIAK